ncbi:MAG: hypothetical protein ACKVXR_00760 [Planctomycetota bacterium]
MLVARGFLPAVLFLTALAVSAAAQSTWYVDVGGIAPGTGTAADPFTRIQYAIDRPATISGDTLLVAPGTYLENVHFNGKALSVIGSGGASATVIDGGGEGPCATIHGGAGVPRLQGSTLTNGSFSFGGGLRVQSVNAIVRDCVIRGNAAAVQGGGVWIGFCSPTLERCVIADNVVTGGSGEGGGMYSMYGFSMSVVNCTVTGNAASTSAGYKSEFSTGATVKNSIFRGNQGVDLMTYQSTVAITYCDVGGGWAGPGTCDADPLVWNAALVDWHLRPGSPCINAGDPAGPNDPDGSVADVGAFPFDPGHCGLPLTRCVAKVNSQGCTPEIGFVGFPSATSPSPFLITADQVINNKLGFLFYGYGPNSAPWQGGTLCVQPPLKRTPASNSGGNPPPNDCSGHFSMDFNARIRSGVDALLIPGATVHAQWYYRDPPSSFGVGSSDAIQLTICP